MTESRTGGRLRIVFIPRHVHSRFALHFFATVTSALVAARMAGGSWLTGLAWYVGSFLGAHVIIVPFLAAALMVRDRFERWVRGIVEEELIRFDLQTYERQLHRVFPNRHTSGNEESTDRS